MLAVGGSGLGLGAALVTGDWGRVPQMSGAALVVAPAVAVLGALAFALCCAAPRWSLLAWAGVAVAVAVGLLAETLGLSQWVRNLSPLQHVPPLPAAPLATTPLVVLAVVAIVLVGMGLIGLRRRDFGAT
jgi:ABC-2 type transport system permease protein